MTFGPNERGAGFTGAGFIGAGFTGAGFTGAGLAPAWRLFFNIDGGFDLCGERLCFN